MSRTDEGWILEANGEPHGPFRAVISAIPLHALQNVTLPPEAPAVPEALYAPVSVVGLGFRSDQVSHPLEGFGALVPAVEREVEILGVLFSSSIFPGRAPSGHVLLTTFLGGTRHAGKSYVGTNDAIRIAASDLSALLGVRGEAVFCRVVHWRRGIPQYEAGYGAVIDGLERMERALPGLHLTGNYRGGISVVDTIENATRTAEKITQTRL